MAGGGRCLWALDFDGVLCNSEPESSASAWRAGLERWPEVFGTEAAAARRAEVLAAMGRVRPVVETGFENMLLVRLLLEGEAGVPEILAGWRSMLPQWMAAWGLERQEMVEFYGRVRDEWISSDLEGWLAPNEFYAGVPEAVNAADPAGLWIVTTKQARFTSLLLNDMAKISTIPDERILSTTVSGVPKTEVLKELQAEHGGEFQKLRFVEDKLSTLEKVVDEAALEDWELYFVDWGFNTAEERAQAAAHPRIELIDLARFAAMLRE